MKTFTEVTQKSRLGYVLLQASTKNLHIVSINYIINVKELFEINFDGVL